MNHQAKSLSFSLSLSHTDKKKKKKEGVCNMIIYHLQTLDLGWDWPNLGWSWPKLVEVVPAKSMSWAHTRVKFWADVVNGICPGSSVLTFLKTMAVIILVVSLSILLFTREPGRGKTHFSREKKLFGSNYWRIHWNKSSMWEVKKGRGRWLRNFDFSTGWRTAIYLLYLFVDFTFPQQICALRRRKFSST